jgi:hypothetical protein
MAASSDPAFRISRQLGGTSTARSGKEIFLLLELEASAVCAREEGIADDRVR